MATCFRTVTHKICCTNYLKSANVVYNENNTISLRKPMQHVNVTGMNVPAVRQLPQVKFLCAGNEHLTRNSLTSFTSNHVSSDDIIMWYRRENGINVPPPIISDYERDAMSRLGLKRKNSSIEEPTPENQGRPSDEQLSAIFNMLSTTLPALFGRPFYQGHYHENVILENHIRGVRTVGIGKYMTQVALLRMLGHFKFAYVRFEILKITKHPEDGTIKCRWRIVGIPGLSVIFQFWKFKANNLARNMDAAPTWYDGFSIYHVGSDGKIYKHVIDKMMPDDDRVEVDPKTTITSKVAIFLGLIPREEQEAFLHAVDNFVQNSSCLSQAMLPLEKI